MGDKSNNSALDVLRTVSALLVVLVHARGWLMVPLEESGGGIVNTALYAMTSLGHGAVLVFFVLSGYFVGSGVIKGFRGGYFSWRKYSVTRIVRLWVVLVPALALTLALDALGRMAFPDTGRYGPSSDAALNTSPAVIFGNLFFFQPTYVPALGSNGALWSLTFEFAYYLLFPIIMIGVLRGSGWRRFAFSALALALCVFFGMHVIILFSAWLLGALIAAYKHRVTATVSAWRPSVRVGTRLLCGAALVGSMLADRISGGSPDHTPPSSFAVAVLAAAFVALLLPDPQPRNRPGRFVIRSLAGLAHSSYSLYAMHLPVLTLLAVAISVNGVTSTWEPSALNWALLLVVVVALVFTGWAFAQFTERHTRPLTKWVLAHVGGTRHDRSVPVSG